MGYSLTEKKVLKKLGIDDFRHMTKDKVVQFASMLPKMDPEVAKAALAQFPEFSGLGKDLTGQLKELVNASFDLSSESQRAFFASCNRILDSLEKELDDEDIDSTERDRIENKMILIAQMLKDKDTENKKIHTHLMDIFTLLCGVVVLAGAAALGAVAMASDYDAENEDNTDKDDPSIIEGEFEEVVE